MSFFTHFQKTGNRVPGNYHTGVQFSKKHALFGSKIMFFGNKIGISLYFLGRRVFTSFYAHLKTFSHNSELSECVLGVVKSFAV